MPLKTAPLPRVSSAWIKTSAWASLSAIPGVAAVTPAASRRR